MKFNKVEELKPDFNKVVLLVEKTKDKTIVSTGYLKSLSAQGCEWVTQQNDFSTIFGRGMQTFKPQFWAEIDLTEVENIFNKENE